MTKLIAKRGTDYERDGKIDMIEYTFKSKDGTLGVLQMKTIKTNDVAENVLLSVDFKSKYYTIFMRK